MAWPTADTDYQYAFPYGFFTGPTDSLDLALEASEALEKPDDLDEEHEGR